MIIYRCRCEIPSHTVGLVNITRNVKNRLLFPTLNGTIILTVTVGGRTWKDARRKLNNYFIDQEWKTTIVAHVPPNTNINCNISQIKYVVCLDAYKEKLK